MAANGQAAESIPSPEEIKAAAARGVRLTPEQVAEISRREEAASPDSRRVHEDLLQLHNPFLLNKSSRLMK